jgi:hypothetical protein
MQMSSRTAKFVSAVFASFLLGSPLATLSPSAARAADDCLAAPKKDQTPQGGHWYYRIDHATKRNCWYLREEREQLSQTTAPKPSQPAQPVAPKPETTMQPSIADAHAELPPQTRIDAPNRDNAFAAAMLAKPAIREEDRDISGAETARSIVASRWPDSSAASPASDPPPNKRDVVASANLVPQTQPEIQAAGQLVAADVSSQTSTYPAPMRLAAALIAALALAGIIAGVIFRFRRTRHPAQPKIRRYRGVSLEATDDDSILLSAEPGVDVLPRRHGFARELDRAGDRERIAEFYAQLSKRN